MRPVLAVGLALLTSLATLSPSAAAGDVRALSVPYRSQLDGNPYQDADCGPASIGMVLAAYGRAIPTMEIREYVNEVQDTVGNHDAGSFIESLWDAAAHYGLEPSGLFAGARGKRGKTPCASGRWPRSGGSSTPVGRSFRRSGTAACPGARSDRTTATTTSS